MSDTRRKRTALAVVPPQEIAAEFDADAPYREIIGRDVFVEKVTGMTIVGKVERVVPGLLVLSAGNGALIFVNTDQISTVMIQPPRESQ